jgi:Tol biopolymer transport system component
VVATANGLYLLSANGQEDRTLANGTAFSNPKISPDGTRIAVLRTDNISLKQQLVLIEFGGDTRTVSTEGGAVLNYSWSPDSKTLALTRANDSNNDGLTDENDKANIWLYDIATTKQQQVAEGRNPTWSPDGVRLAFIIPGPASNPNEIDPSTHKPAKTPNAIGVYNVQNKASRNLLSAKGLEFALKEVSDEPTLKASSVTLRYFKEVSWYPDSKRITVSADATGPNNLRTGLIMTLTIDETNPRLVTAGGDAVLRPLWSPDGKRLAFETEPQYPLKANKNGFAIGLLDNADPVKAVPTRQFVGDPATRNYARAPLWINGGQQLAFIMSDNAILSVVDADGKNERNLISGCSGFDWY